MRPLYPDGIADAGQHVGDWISEHIRRLSRSNLSRTNSVLNSYKNLDLPTRFADAGDQTLVGQLTKTDSADAEFPIHGPRPAAHVAAALKARRKFRRLFGFGKFGFTGHKCLA